MTACSFGVPRIPDQQPVPCTSCRNRGGRGPGDGSGGEGLAGSVLEAETLSLVRDGGSRRLTKAADSRSSASGNFGFLVVLGHTVSVTLTVNEGVGACSQG